MEKLGDEAEVVELSSAPLRHKYNICIKFLCACKSCKQTSSNLQSVKIATCKNVFFHSVSGCCHSKNKIMVICECTDHDEYIWVITILIVMTHQAEEHQDI